MRKKSGIQWLLCLAIPLAVGGLSALLTRGSMDDYSRLIQPPLSPPGWVFPVVWTLLFVMMGAASCLVLRSQQPRAQVRQALALYGAQLALNFLWPILFFNLGAFLPAFLLLVVLWLLIGVTALQFSRLSRWAGLLLVPYLLWVTFAGYLNLSIYLLN